MSSPGVPVDPVSKRIMRSTQVQSVKVGSVTCVVPPCSFVLVSAVITTIHIAVLIFGSKLHATIDKDKVKP